MKTLILELTSFGMFEILSKVERNDDINFNKLVFGKNRFIKLIRRFTFSHKLFFRKIFYFKWWRKLKKYDRVIIFDSKYSPQVIKDINNKYKNLRVILFYWNSITESIKLTELEHLNCEVWTYSKEEANKYNLEYNTTFFSKKIVDLYQNKNNNRAFYIGASKNRENQLNLLAKELEKNNVGFDFYIKNYNNKIINNNIHNLKKNIPYNKMLEKETQYKYLVDLNADFASGMSLRPVEALFFGKYIITFNPKILEFDLFENYRSRIIIFDANGINLVENTENKRIDFSDIIEFYDFPTWLKRFDKQGEIK